MELRGQHTFHLVILLWTMLCGGTSHAQTDSLIYLHGQVTDAFTQRGLSNVNISVDGTYIGTTTNRLGKYTLGIPLNLAKKRLVNLEFSHLGYAPKKVPLDDAKNKKLNVALDPQGYQFKEVTVSGQPTVVYGNINYQLFDYELKDGLLYLIGYEKRLSKSTLLVVNEENEILYSHRIPSLPIKLVKDCTDEIYAVTQDYFLRVVIESEELFLTIVKQNNLNRLINGCVDRTGDNFYFEYFAGSRFAKRFYHLDSNKRSYTLIREIEDDKMIRRAKDEADFLAAGDYRTAHGYEVDLAFGQKIMLKPLDVALRTVHDTVYIFNHFENQVEGMDLNGNLRFANPISYHQEKNWGKEIIKDPIQQKLYTFHSDNGHTEIAQIFPTTGTIKTMVRTDFRYIEKIQVYDGEVYFLYRPFGSLQKKTLYKKTL